MADDSAGKSCRDALRVPEAVHDRQLASQREWYEQRLRELRRENALLHRRLAKASSLIASLGPLVRLHGDEALKAQHQECADAGSNPQECPSPGPCHALAPSTATPSMPPAAVSPAGPASPPLGVGANGAPCGGPRWLWEVIGGGGKGGILVRQGESMDSQQFAVRLSRGAVVKEIELNADRLHFQLLTGAGPKEGWISTKLQGKALAVKYGLAPLQPWQGLPATVGLKGEKPLPIALLFGQDQGHPFIPSHSQGFPQLTEMLNKASSVLGFHFLRELLVKENLTNMVWMRSMVMTFIASFANLERLRCQRPEAVGRAAGMAGIGPGIFDALCAAGVLSFEDSIRLLMAYAKLLARSTRRASQMMISVAGLEQGKLQLMCLQAREAEGERSFCQISAYLAGQYFFVGGTEGAVQMVWEMAMKAGAQVGLLGNIAVNTAMMSPMQAELDALLSEALPNMSPPLHAIWTSVIAEPRRPGCDPADIVADLKDGFARPALLQQCTDAMCMEGVNQFYHILPLTQQNTQIQPSDIADWPYLSGAGRSLAIWL